MIWDSVKSMGSRNANFSNQKEGSEKNFKVMKYSSVPNPALQGLPSVFLECRVSLGITDVQRRTCLMGWTFRPSAQMSGLLQTETWRRQQIFTFLATILVWTQGNQWSYSGPCALEGPALPVSSWKLPSLHLLLDHPLGTWDPGLSCNNRPSLSSRVPAVGKCDGVSALLLKLFILYWSIVD